MKHDNKYMADMILKYINKNKLHEFVNIYFDNICYYWEEEAQEHTTIYDIEAPISLNEYLICIKIDSEVTHKLSYDLLEKKIKSLEDGFKCLGLECKKYDMMTFYISD